METPLSTKRITRSQTKAAAAAAAAAAMNSVPMSRKNEEEVPESKQRKGGRCDRSALIDITNDSPIVGLAMGSSLMKTPSSFSKKKDVPKMRMIMTTPGSGEALLRREVKTLLQKVEEEAAAAAAEGSKLSFEHHHRLFLHFEEDHVVDPSSSSSSSSGSGFGFVRPMINNNNTPHVFFNPTYNKSNGSGDHHIKGNSLKPSQVEAEFKIPQVVERIDGGGLMKQESLESEKSLITRSLLFDFSEKSSVEASSESSSICSSVGSVSQVLLLPQSNEEEEDDDGVWSIRVNNKSTSSIQSKEEEYYEEEEEDYEGESEVGGGLMIDELCEGVMKISVNEKMRMGIGAEFEGKHTRFVYNSEDEIEGEEEDVVVMGGIRRKSSLRHLKGLPTPVGKHLRFSSNEDAEEEQDD